MSKLIATQDGKVLGSKNGDSIKVYEFGSELEPVYSVNDKKPDLNGNVEIPYSLENAFIESLDISPINSDSEEIWISKDNKIKKWNKILNKLYYLDETNNQWIETTFTYSGEYKAHQDDVFLFKTATEYIVYNSIDGSVYFTMTNKVLDETEEPTMYYVNELGIILFFGSVYANLRVYYYDADSWHLSPGSNGYIDALLDSNSIVKTIGYYLILSGIFSEAVIWYSLTDSQNYNIICRNPFFAYYPNTFSINSLYVYIDLETNVFKFYFFASNIVNEHFNVIKIINTLYKTVVQLDSDSNFIITEAGPLAYYSKNNNIIYSGIISPNEQILIGRDSNNNSIFRLYHKENKYLIPINENFSAQTIINGLSQKNVDSLYGKISYQLISSYKVEQQVGNDNEGTLYLGIVRGFNG